MPPQGGRVPVIFRSPPGTDRLTQDEAPDGKPTKNAFPGCCGFTGPVPSTARDDQHFKIYSNGGADASSNQRKTRSTRRPAVSAAQLTMIFANTRRCAAALSDCHEHLPYQHAARFLSNWIGAEISAGTLVSSVARSAESATFLDEVHARPAAQRSRTSTRPPPASQAICAGAGLCEIVWLAVNR